MQPDDHPAGAVDGIVRAECDSFAENLKVAAVIVMDVVLVVILLIEAVKRDDVRKCNLVLPQFRLDLAPA